MCFIGWFQIYGRTGLRIYDFFLMLRLLFDDDGVVDSDSEKYFRSFIGLFYLLSLLGPEVLVLQLYLIPKLCYLFLKIVL